MEHSNTNACNVSKDSALLQFADSFWKNIQASLGTMNMSSSEYFKQAGTEDNALITDLPSHEPNALETYDTREISTPFYCPVPQSRLTDEEKDHSGRRRPYVLEYDRRQYILRALRPVRRASKRPKRSVEPGKENKCNVNESNLKERTNSNSKDSASKNAERLQEQQKKGVQKDSKRVLKLEDITGVQRRKKKEVLTRLIIAAKAMMRLEGKKDLKRIVQGGMESSERRRWAEACQNWTVDELKAYLRACGGSISTTGGKAVLIRRVHRHLMPRVELPRRAS